MKAFRFDFESRQVEVSFSGPLSSSNLRNAVQVQAEKFTALSLRNGSTGVYDCSDGVQIVISSLSIYKESFRTGNLTLKFKLSSGGDLSGKISFRGHFYEKGNAVGEQCSEFREGVSGGDDETLAANAIKKISTFYGTWNDAVHHGFELLTSEGLDRLRRKLPITKTHVNWRQEIIGAAAMPSRK
jgi:hypothetical protein